MRSGSILGAFALTLVAAPAAATVEHSTLAGGTEGIYLTGEIQASDGAAFRELAGQFANAMVFLESPGGDIVPAIEIGKLIRQHGYTTVVLADGTCTSSCALIWLAGTPRYLSPEGNLGFHAGYTEEGGRRLETGVGNAVIGFYLSQLNLSEKAVIFATSASPYTIAWLNAANSGDAEIGFEPAPASLPRPPESFLALSGPLQKAKAAPAPTKAESAPDPAKDDPPESEESAPSKARIKQN